MRSLYLHRKYTKEDLQARFGQATGIWLHSICRGIDFTDGQSFFETAVHVLGNVNNLLITSRATVTRCSDVSKSMMTAKSFCPPVRDMTTIAYWLNILATELFVRLQSDFKFHARWPKCFSVGFK